MPDLYNLSGLQNATTVVDVIIYANNTVDQILVGGFMLAFFIIMTTALLRRYDILESITVASFVCFFVSSFLRLAGLVSFNFPLLFALGFSLPLIYFLVRKR